MYNVSKGPSKIVTQTRRGIPQGLEPRRDNTKKASGDNEVISVPKPVFHSNGNYKKYNSNRVIHDIITPQHEELIRFINDSWNSVYSQYEQHSRTGTPSTISNDSSHSGETYSPNLTSSPTVSDSVVYYEDGEPNAIMQNFIPFDLESWWGKRLYRNITESL